MQTIFSKTNHEVFVITANGEPSSGFIATWVLPASLVPGTPRLLVLASPLNYTTQLIRDSKKFVVNLLADDQSSLIPHFGLLSGKSQDKLASIDHQESDFGPLLDHTCGYAQCLLSKEVDLGERVILIGDVEHHTVHPKEALTKNHGFGSLPEEIRQQLVEKHRTLGEESRALFGPLT